MIAVDVCAPPSVSAHWLCPDEDAALARARREVGPNQTQLTLTATTADVETFALRHLTWRDGAQHDSGWRIWRVGRFIGGGELRDLAS